MTVVDVSAISRLLEESRRGLDRVDPLDLGAAKAAGALVVDMRPVEQRDRYGELPGAVVIDRNVLEWRLDPSSPHRLPIANDPERRIVLVCQEGYSSSLAAHTLQQLGLRNATDLRGGFEAWAALTRPAPTPARPARPPASRRSASASPRGGSSSRPR
jgi:rhodanese-related sulfurtransferase